MSEYTRRVRRQQIYSEVEGYLDLLTALEPRYSATPAVRDRLALFALSRLECLDEACGRRVQAQYLRGLALRTLERHSDAILPLENAADRAPERTELWLALAWCQKRCGRLDLAIQALEDALAADANEPIVHYNLACYWSLAHNIKLALAYLANALSLNPDLRDLVADEPDFDPIRNHPEFQLLTSGEQLEA